MKKKNKERLVQEAKRIREVIIETVGKNGGHLGPNLGVVELTLALHEVFDSPNDKILFDVGHQSYVHKLLTGREEKFHTLRKRHGISPFTDPKESEHDHFISGHAGSGMSAASGIAAAIPKDKKVIVVVGDASIANGHSLEALNNIDKGFENLIIILNDNEMSIGPNVGSLSSYLSRVMGSKLYLGLKNDVEGIIRRGKIGNRVADIMGRVEHGVKTIVAPGNISELLGFKYIGPINGHNIEALLSTLETVKNLKGPVLYHVKTKKGCGFELAENNPEKFHGLGPFDPKTGDAPSNGKKSYSQVFGDKLVDLGKEDKGITALCCGMVKGTGLSDFFAENKSRSYDMGISEGHTVTFAGGLASQGKKPYVAIYSTFLQRAYGQMIHDISLQSLPIRFILDRSGIVGADGKTHQGIYDTPYLLTIPRVDIFAPTSRKELEEILEFSKKDITFPMAVKIARDSAWEYDTPKFEYGRWHYLDKKVGKGKKILILAVGTMVREIKEIQGKLEKEGIDIDIVGISNIRPLDKKFIETQFPDYETIITVEEGQLRGGFGSYLLEETPRNQKEKINRLGIEKDFVSHGERDELLKELGLRGESLILNIKRCIDGNK